MSVFSGLLPATADVVTGVGVLLLVAVAGYAIWGKD